jgi:hypothetical protein
MAWHHALHAHASRHAKSFLMAAAASHPLLTTVLAVVGVGAIAYEVTGLRTSSSTSVAKIPPAGVTS